MSSLIHMESEVVRAVIDQLRRILAQMHQQVDALRRLPAPDSWWTGGWAAEQFASEWRFLQDRLRQLTEEGWMLVSQLEQEFHQWQAADARFGDQVSGLCLAGGLGGWGSAVTSAWNGLVGAMAYGLGRLLAWVSDPVDVRVGYYVDERIDLTLPPGPPFALKRVYISHPEHPGWRFLLPLRIIHPASGRIRVPLDTQGVWRLEFHQTPEGWRGPVAGYALEETEAGFQFRTPEGEVFVFDREGRLRRWQDVLGRGVHFEPKDERLWQVLAPWGARWAEIRLDDQGRILQVVDAEGRALHYTYDDQGRLAAFTDRSGQTTRYTYNAHGWLQRIVGPSGQVLVENEYDDRGRVVAQRDATGQTTRFAYESDALTGQLHRVVVTYPNGARVTYHLERGEVARQETDDAAMVYRRDERGFLVEIRDPNGKTWTLDWDEAGRLTGFVDPAGHAYRLRYDEQGAVLSLEDPAGGRMEVTYDPHHRPIRLCFPDGAEIGFEYDEQGRVAGWVDPTGTRVTFVYDELGRVTRIQLPDGGTYAYAYQGNEVVETDPLGRQTVYTYDGEDRLLAVRRNGHGVQLAYTPDGHLSSLQDEQGRTVQVEYDARGLPVRLRFPNGYTLRQTYDALGHPVELRDGQGRLLLKRVYDPRGRLIALIDGKGKAWRYTYDKAGNLIAVTDRKGRTFRFEYDEAYRPIRIYDPEDRVQVSLEYDARNLPLRMADAEGHTMAFTFDPLGRLTAVNWDGLEARADLDAAGRLIRLMDEKGRSRTYAYDAQGRLLRETYPLNQVYAYSYDARGRLQAQTLPDGTRIEVTYDALDRPVRLTYHQNGEVFQTRWRYSDDGNEMVISDPSGEVRYRLFPQENALERIDVFGHAVRYSFTPEGHIQRLVYPDGRAVEYEYDANGNLTFIRDFAGHETHIEYDANDLPVKVVHPNGLVTLYEYDALDRVVKIRHLNVQGERLVEQHIRRDATGRVVEVKVEGPALQGLERRPDARSRRRFTFNELDQIVTTDEGPFRYDARGNLTAYRDAGQSVTLHYDLQDRLVESRLDGVHLRYAYDPEGNRVAVTRNGRTRRYILDTVLDLPRPLMEMDEDGRVLRYYIWGLGLQYALDVQGRPYVYLFNHRGDTLAVVDGEGRIVAAYDYAAYGQVIGHKGEEVPFRFLGRWGVMTDHEGLVYIRARYYAPRLGFFIQPDRLHIYAPIPHFLNRYAYALDEPWDLVDVDGRLPQIVAGAIIGGVVGGVMEVVKQTVFEGKSLAEIDFRSVGAAIAGGSVSGAIVSTGIGAVPILGGAISGAAGSVVQTTLDNVLHGRPWTQEWGEAITTGLFTGAIADVGALALRIGSAGWGAWRHGLDPVQAIKTSAQRALFTPWKRLLSSPYGAFTHTRGNLWKRGLETGIAGWKVLKRLENPLAPVTPHWWRFTFQGLLADLVINLGLEKQQVYSGG